MKNKFLCGLCIVIILSMALCVLATASHINLTATTDLLPPPAGTDSILDDNVVAPDTVDDTNDNMTNDMTDNFPLTDGMTNDAPMTDGTAGDMSGDMTDMLPMPETNVPDENIGGAVADNDKDNIPDAEDTDDDNDGIDDAVDSDADGDGIDDEQKTVGIVGIVIATAVVLAVIVIMIAVIPKKKKP